MKKIFFILALILGLLLNEFSVHAKVPDLTNPKEIEQDVHKEDENFLNYDGHKWKALSFEQKSSFYYGYELGRIMTVERINELRKLTHIVIEKAVSPEIKEEFKDLHDGLYIFSEFLEKYETVVAQEEMVSLVDKFYDNPANLKIRLHHAFVINKLIKDGASAKAIKNLIDLYRKKDKNTGNLFFLSPRLPILEAPDA